MCFVTMNGYIVIAVMVACWMCLNEETEGSAINTVAATSTGAHIHESSETPADYNYIINIIEGLQSQLSAIEEENEQLNNKMSASENRGTILEEQNHQSKEKHNKLSNQIKSTLAEDMKQLTYRMSALENKVTSSEKQNNALKNQNDKLSNQINNLEKEMAAFNKRVDGLPQDARPFSTNDMQQNVSNHLFGQEYKQCLSKWQVQEEHNNNFRDKISQLENCKFRMQSSFVSFTASASASRNYNTSQVVLFDSVLRNYGNFYNVTTSVFTCPFTGYYWFSNHIMAESQQLMGTIIELNGTGLVRTYAQDLDRYGHSSNSIVTLCESGQNVYISATYDGSSMYYWSTFSGTLLRIL